VVPAARKAACIDRGWGVLALGIDTMGRGASLAAAAALVSAATTLNAESLLSASTRSLIDRFEAAVAPSLSAGRLVEAALPAVGCPQDGQMGPIPAPALPGSVRVIIPEGLASRLAYYSASDTVGTGVVAPRGWSCFGVYGPSGESLTVMPQSSDVPILDRGSPSGAGRVVIRDLLVGGTSGRFLIAKVSAGIFPKARKAVETLRDAGPADPDDHASEAWPADRIFRLSDFVVGYMTPPETDGLGTIFGPAPGRGSVRGLAFLTGGVDDPSLVRLAVRLGEADQALYPSIATSLIISLTSDVRDADPQGSR